MTVVDVYSRRGCHLCELLIEELTGMLRGRAELAVHDVDTRPDWRARYGDAVPVVECEGRELCRHRLAPERIEAALAAARLQAP